MCNGFHRKITNATIQFIMFPIDRVVLYVLTDAEQFVFIPDNVIVKAVLQYVCARSIADFIYPFANNGFDPAHE